MKILMIAPEPFFQTRGTPFSIYHRLKALSRLGHEVDLLTYHLGEDAEFPGVRICRIPKVPFIRHVGIGPSFTKLPLDAVLFSKTVAFFARGDYDCVHTHEEAAVLGAILQKFFRVPHIYDMHSSLPQQFINYNFFKIFPGLFLKMANSIEGFILRNADAVIAICPHLKTIALEAGARGRVDVIENVALIPPQGEVTEEAVARLKKEYGVGKRLIALYTGTFEYNQGIEHIVESIPRVVKEVPDIVFLLVGGEKAQVRNIRALSRKLGVERYVRVPGKKAIEEMPAYMEACDLLLSFRKIGTNTPLKLYSYLWSGKPTVATNLPVHTQVLDNNVAELTEPTPEAFARGVITLARDRELRLKMGRDARRLAEQKYTYDIYLTKIRDLCSYVEKKKHA
jgi:glycosyltransferase involved in cell wall biosynthesis